MIIILLINYHFATFISPNLYIILRHFPYYDLNLHKLCVHLFPNNCNGLSSFCSFIMSDASVIDASQLKNYLYNGLIKSIKPRKTSEEQWEKC